MNTAEYEIIRIDEFPEPDERGQWVRYKYITFKAGRGQHELKMPSDGFTAEKANAEIKKMVQDLLKIMKPKGE